MIQTVNLLSARDIFVYKRSGNIYQNVCIVLQQFGINVLDKVFYSAILQSDRIKHAGSSLCPPGILISLSGVQGRPLRDEAPKLVYVNKIIEFSAVSKGTGSSQNRVFELEPCNINT